jgi:hypothetical protein
MSDVDVSRVFARLRAEVEARPATGDASAYRSGEPPRLAWRVTAERFASVTGDLPYMHRPGTFGRAGSSAYAGQVRASQANVLLRRAGRGHQRELNAAVFSLLDELTGWTAEQVARLERSSEK